jgi:hypothetical protein
MHWAITNKETHFSTAMPLFLARSDKKPNLRNKRKMDSGEEMPPIPIVLRYPNLLSPIIINNQSSNTKRAKVSKA